jgi:hypothetical protein
MLTFSRKSFKLLIETVVYRIEAEETGSKESICPLVHAE